MSKGLLFVWEENGKKYGHWTGSDVPGRLPPPSWRARLERLAPPVPQTALAKYSSSFSSSRLKAVPGKAQGQDLDLDLDLGLDLAGEVKAAAPPFATEDRKSKPPVNSPGEPLIFDHPRMRISQLDAKLVLEFLELPEPARRAEYQHMAAKLEESAESVRSPGNYARAWLRRLGGGGSSAGKSLAVQRDLWAGTASRPAAYGVSVKAAVLERIRAREAAEREARQKSPTQFASESKEKAS